MDKVRKNVTKKHFFPFNNFSFLPTDEGHLYHSQRGSYTFRLTQKHFSVGLSRLLSEPFCGYIPPHTKYLNNSSSSNIDVGSRSSLTILKRSCVCAWRWWSSCCVCLSWPCCWRWLTAVSMASTYIFVIIQNLLMYFSRLVDYVLCCFRVFLLHPVPWRASVGEKAEVLHNPGGHWLLQHQGSNVRKQRNSTWWWSAWMAFIN